MKHTVGKAVLRTVGVLLTAVILAVLVYVSYVLTTYSRIDDRLELTPFGGGTGGELQTGREYTVVTQNIGFGAYTADFTFFMDGGKQSRAVSGESVVNCVSKATAQVQKESPDFVLFQEVDFDSTRSYHIDQKALLQEAFSGYDGVFAVNYHSAYLMYPLTEPHGASNSGIMTLSRYPVTSGLRRQLPISTGFSKFLDLDRCYTVSRIPVENGKELVLYNVHLSAYGNSDEIRTAQMTMLLSDMKAEYDAGNYCVCGGDFNHDFTGNSTTVLNGAAAEFGWAMPFPAELIPEGIFRCIRYDEEKTLPTCRNCDVPYKPGNFTIIVDGFLASENVDAVSVQNVQTGFVYSDHNPVVLRFVLKGE